MPAMTSKRHRREFSRLGSPTRERHRLTFWGLPSPPTGCLTRHRPSPGESTFTHTQPYCLAWLEASVCTLSGNARVRLCRTENMTSFTCCVCSSRLEWWLEYSFTLPSCNFKISLKKVMAWQGHKKVLGQIHFLEFSKLKSRTEFHCALYEWMTQRWN